MIVSDRAGAKEYCRWASSALAVKQDVKRWVKDFITESFDKHVSRHEKGAVKKKKKSFNLQRLRPDIFQNNVSKGIFLLNYERSPIEDIQYFYDSIVCQFHTKR